MSRSVCLLFDHKRSAWKSSIRSDRLLRRKYRPVSDLVPDRQRETEVHILGTVQFVVNAVVVRTHKDSSQRAEPEIRIRVLERNKCCVGD